MSPANREVSLDSDSRAFDTGGVATGTVSFLGSPEMDLIPATLDGNTAVLSGGNKLALVGKRQGKARQPVILGIRPQHVALSGKTAAIGH